MDSTSTLSREISSQLTRKVVREVAASAPTITREEIERWLIERIASLSASRADAIGIDRPFADFALDSALVISVTNELSRWLGKELSVTLFWEYPTIEELAKNLVSA